MPPESSLSETDSSYLEFSAGGPSNPPRTPYLTVPGQGSQDVSIAKTPSSKIGSGPSSKKGKITEGFLPSIASASSGSSLGDTRVRNRDIDFVELHIKIIAVAESIVWAVPKDEPFDISEQALREFAKTLGEVVERIYVPDERMKKQHAWVYGFEFIGKDWAAKAYAEMTRLPALLQGNPIHLYYTRPKTKMVKVGDKVEEQQEKKDGRLVYNSFRIRPLGIVNDKILPVVMNEITEEQAMNFLLNMTDDEYD